METQNIVLLAISIILFIIMLIFLFLILYDKKINVYIKWSVLIVSIILLIFSLYNTDKYWLKNRNELRMYDDNFDIIEDCGNDKLCREINQLLDTMEDNIYDLKKYESLEKIIQLLFDNNEISKLNSIKIEEPLYWKFLNNKFNRIKELVPSDINNIKFSKGTLEIRQ